MIYLVHYFKLSNMRMYSYVYMMIREMNNDEMTGVIDGHESDRAEE